MSKKTASKRKKAKKNSAAKSNRPVAIDVAHLLHKGSALHQSGKYPAARKSYTKILASEPQHYDALQLLGALELSEGNHEKAVHYISRAIELRPGLPALHYNMGVALLNLGRLKQGYEQLHSALELDPEFLLANYELGARSLDAGLLADATLYLEKANRLRPQHPETVVMLACAWAQEHRLEQAAQLLQQQLCKDQQKADYFYRVGMRLRSFGQWGASVQMLHQAYRLSKGNETVVNGYAEGLERVSRLQEADACLRHYIANHPDYGIRTAVILVRVLRRTGHPDEAYDIAQQHLRSSGDDEMLAELNKEVGMLKDKDGDYAAAWELFTRSNGMMKRRALELAVSYTDMPQLVSNCLDWCADGASNLASDTRESETLRAPVFYCGFPRSGTTLMGNMLSRHPDISVFHEVPTLNRIADMMEELIGRTFTYPDDIHTLDDNELAHLREVYWGKLGLSAQGADSRGVVVDKMPLNFIYLPLALRLFPQAKILFALRDPRDACLSCYMQYFEINPAMVQFHEMDTTINMYRLSMKLWQEYKGRLAPHYREYRYEDLVVDPRAELSAILQFIGVEWDDAVLHQGVERGKSVATPSYEAIVEPVNAAAVSRWQNYEEYLQPFIGDLQPYLSCYNY